MNAISQQQARFSSFQSVTVASAVRSEKLTITQSVHAGFTLGAPLPARTAYGKGFILGFVEYRSTTVVRQTVEHSFSVSAPLPRTKNPVQELREKGQQDPSMAMLYSRKTTTTYQVTEIAVFYCVVLLGQAVKRSVPPPPKPLPAQPPKQLPAGHVPAVRATPSFKPTPEPVSGPAAATGSLNPVGPAKASGQSNWEYLPGVTPKKARYELWGMENSNRMRPVEFSLTGSPNTVRKVTPRELARDGLSFSAVNENNAVESIPLDKVSSFRVLNA
ncbi:hypothetical protein GCM10023165_09910 [Variovorax defluvii]|uniref:Uncharacterized protein n=1 Tax=Variovorax defluvii TaxID=913761 RepID=A0ABP8H4I6_9BURK